MEQNCEEDGMRASWKSAVLLLLLLLGTVPGRAEAAGAAEPSGVASLNGYVWERSAPQSRLDFLLGVECALAMESALAQAAQNKGESVTLSLFADGWQAALGSVTRPELVRRIDAFYEKNPDQKNRHVFDVIWTEMVVPGLKARP